MTPGSTLPYPYSSFIVRMVQMVYLLRFGYRVSCFIPPSPLPLAITRRRPSVQLFNSIRPR